MPIKKDEEVKATAPVEPVKAPEPEMVTVPASQLKTVLDKVEALEKSSQEDRKTISALEQTVSKTKLDEAKASADQDKRARVHFKLIDGKPVVGWKSVKNEVIFNPTTNMPMGEKLTAIFYFPDGTDSGEIDQIKLTRATGQAYARVVEDAGDEGLLEFEDKSLFDKALRIHKRFWNA